MKIAIVLGGADTLYEDFYKAMALVRGHDYELIATNNAGRDYPGPLDHWVTLHTEPGKMPTWMEERLQLGYGLAANFWTSNTPRTIPDEHLDLYKKVQSWNGSSGLLAVQVGLELGCDKIILCGVPLDKKAAHYDDSADWMDAPRYRSAWTRRLELMKGKVKSFSGWTSLILGEPDESWINSES